MLHVAGAHTLAPIIPSSPTAALHTHSSPAAQLAAVAHTTTQAHVSVGVSTQWLTPPPQSSSLPQASPGPRAWLHDGGCASVAHAPLSMRFHVLRSQRSMPDAVAPGARSPPSCVAAAHVDGAGSLGQALAAARMKTTPTTRMIARYATAHVDTSARYQVVRA
jgi:hypothetical protein